ncbi:LCP family protein [Paenibacillus sp.]|jgi:LCP family protein required for cell wall assembly|uniref:LCP family glycopolymer transferase n=1 Tax=Paenibacillus sp. TaxID=58172 RepID=UPI0028323FE6|nr:LCP family protein [Paenibacillus sp.]MDR0267620.1 LCP family protein [Paenibacillus sp.]
MKKFIIIGSTVLLSIIFIGVGYSYYVYNAIEKTVDKMQITFEEPGHNELVKIEDTQDVLTFLLLGIGDRPRNGDVGRADSIIVASVNPKVKKVLMFNIPRDSRVEIVGKNKMDKINHAYAYGGIEMTKKTVERFLNQPIDYVLQTNMEGLTQLVDVFGGIEVYNDFAFDQMDQYGEKNHHYEQGLIQLDGERALHYSRMRKSDPKGDLGRNERQRQVLTILLNKMDSLSSVLKMEETLNIIGDNIKTNITFDKMKSFFLQFKRDWKEYQIQPLEIAGSNQTIQGVYYYHVPDKERERISASLKEHAVLGSTSN